MAARVETYFTADTKDFDRRMTQLENRVNRYSGQAAKANQKAAQAFKKPQAELAILGNQLTKLAPIIAGAFSAKEVIAMADTFTQFTAKLVNAGIAAKDMAGVQEQLIALAKTHGSELTAVGSLYGSIAMSSKELGATQADMMKATNGVAAALRLSGSDASQTSAVMLQLGQALGGGTVRAEEFNSMLENAPMLVRAVAESSDKWGGSVSKLRAAVNDGKVSSKEYFDAILKGSADLEARAANAPKTVAMAYQNLQTAMIAYVGQADQSLGATEKLSYAIEKIASNIDDLANVAMAGLYIAGARGVGILTKLAVAKTAAGVAAVRLTAFNISMTASMTGVSRASLLASTAMTKLNASMSFFGGPLGLAITAIATAIFLVVDATKKAKETNEAYENAVKNSTKTLQDSNAALAGLKSSSDNAASGVSNLSSNLRDQASAARQAYIENMRLVGSMEAVRAGNLAQYAANMKTIQELEKVPLTERVLSLSVLNRPSYYKHREERLNKIKELEAFNTQLMKDSIKVAMAPEARWTSDSGTGSGSGSGSGEGKKDKKDNGPKTATPEEQAATAAELQRGYEREVASILAEMTGTMEARHAHQLRQLEWELEDEKNSIADKALAKDITDAQAAQALLEAQKVNDLKVQAELQKQQVEKAEQAVRDLQDANDHAAELRGYEAEILDNLAKTTKTRQEQYQYEDQAFALRQSQEKAAFDAREAEIEATLRLAGQLTAEAEERAKQRKDAFDRKQQSERDAKGTEDRQRDPMTAYIDKLRNGEGGIDEAMVRGLESFEEGLSNVITNTEKLGDVFKNVANQIIADLARMYVRQKLMLPLMNMMGLGGGGGAAAAGAGGAAKGVGLVGGIGKLLGFQAGTNFAPGGLVEINEGGYRGGEIVDLPRGSKVIPARAVDKLIGEGRQMISSTSSAVNIHVDANNAVLAGQIRNEIATAVAIGMSQTEQNIANRSIKQQSRSLR